MKFCEGQKLADDPLNGCAVLRGQVQHVWLPPNNLGKIKGGVREIVESTLGKYNKKLDGIPLAFRSIKIIPRAAVLLYDDVDMHFDVQYDVVVFRVVPGSLIRCKVNEVAADHLSCLVHEMINLAVPLPDFNFDLHHPKGLEVVCRVQNVEYEKGLVGISAELTDDSVRTLQEFYVEMTERYNIGGSPSLGSDSPQSQDDQLQETTDGGRIGSDDNGGFAEKTSGGFPGRTTGLSAKDLLHSPKAKKRKKKEKEENRKKKEKGKQKTLVKKKELVTERTSDSDSLEDDLMKDGRVGIEQSEEESIKHSGQVDMTQQKKRSRLEDSEEPVLKEATKIGDLQETALVNELSKELESQKDRESSTKSGKKKRKVENVSEMSENDLLNILPFEPIKDSFVTSTAKKRKRERTKSISDDPSLSWEDSVASLKGLPESPFTSVRKKEKKRRKKSHTVVTSLEKSEIVEDKMGIAPQTSSDGKSESTETPKDPYKKHHGEEQMIGPPEKESRTFLQDSEHAISSVSEDLGFHGDPAGEIPKSMGSSNLQEPLSNLEGKKRKKKLKRKLEDLEGSTQESSVHSGTEDVNSIWYGFSDGFDKSTDLLKILAQESPKRTPKKKEKRRSKGKVEKRPTESSKELILGSKADEVDDLLSIPSVSSGFVEPTTKRKHSKKDKGISKKDKAVDPTQSSLGSEGALSELSQFVIPSPAELEEMGRKRKGKKKRKRITSGASDKTNDSGINVSRD